MNDNSNREVVDAFLKHCQWIQDCWEMHSSFFNNNPARENLKQYSQELNRFLISYHHISLAYTVLQIGKLHDQRKDTLNIGYIWKIIKDPYKMDKTGLIISDNQELNRKTKEFEDIKNCLEGLIKEEDGKEAIIPIIQARNNILAHNNINVYTNPFNGQKIPTMEMNNYMKKLERLCDILFEIWPIQNSKIKSSAKEDTEAVVKLLISLCIKSD